MLLKEGDNEEKKHNCFFIKQYTSSLGTTSWLNGGGRIEEGDKYSAVKFEWLIFVFAIQTKLSMI